MFSKAVIARALASAFVAGPFEVDGLIARGADLFGKRWVWLNSLANRACARFQGRMPPRHVTVTQFLLGDAGFHSAFHKNKLLIKNRIPCRPAMTPVSAAVDWSLPPLRTTRELADWLRISIADLEWFADRKQKGRQPDAGRLAHYHYRPLTKRFGRIRLIEAPKPRLKAIQRQILSGILEHIPAHEAAHGFRPGGSIQSFARDHVGKRVVIRMDLEDFFPSISQAWVYSIFRTAGYPELVADLLAGLCCNATPRDVWREIAISQPVGRQGNLRHMYSQPHVPQGAPSSPALANLAAFRLDNRLLQFAVSADAHYTRYGDDLAFSGDCHFERMVDRFVNLVAAIVMDEGFSVHFRKTRIMRQGVRQSLTGLVVNKSLNVPRTEYDRTKAMLTNCVRRGPSTQNQIQHSDFRAHLLGKISFIQGVNFKRGVRLKELFDQIDWSK